MAEGDQVPYGIAGGREIVDLDMGQAVSLDLVHGDGHLQRALDQLARVGGEFIDYRDLAERHLGTIYEGLLEHTLQPMREPVWAQGVVFTVAILLIRMFPDGMMARVRRRA